MKVSQLLEITRRELDDFGAPFLWTDDELLEYAQDAQEEACRRARLIVDATTTAICRITVAASTAVYALDARVVRINRAKLASQDRPLEFAMVRDLDRQYPGWESWSEIPSLIVPDWETGKIRLVGTPNAGDTLSLTVVRLPLAAPSYDDDLEVRAEYQRNLRHWIMYRAYQKRDSETYRPDMADACLQRFMMEFGPPRPAYDELWQQQYYATDGMNGRY